jgi:hypothetical protein
MAIVFTIFMIGLFVSLVVAKGMMQANDFAKDELRKMNDLPFDDQEENES